MITKGKICNIRLRAGNVDNLTHTLVGVGLGEIGLKHRTPRATTALVIGANLPDLDVLALVGGADFQFGFRRGWTHGFLGVLVLPVVLTGVLVLYQRWRKSDGSGPEIRLGWLLALAYLATLTHPALDWLNTYGMRWGMPFDGTWTYGDTLFIVDPWMWLVLGLPVVLAWSRTTRAKVGWAVLGILTSVLVAGTPLVPAATKGVWFVGVAVILVLRVAPRPPGLDRALAVAALAVSALYVALMLAGSRAAATEARRWWSARDVSVSAIMAGPVPANPFERDLIAVTPDAYRFARASWSGRIVVLEGEPAIPINDGIVARAVREVPALKGFFRWARFPAFEVESRDDGYRVSIRDVRYARRVTGFGSAWAELDGELRPIRAGINTR